MYTSAMNVTKNNHCPLGVQSTTLMSESLKPKCGREQDSQPDPLDIKVFSLSSTGVIARERTTINLDCSRELYGVILSSYLVASLSKSLDSLWFPNHTFSHPRALHTNTRWPFCI